jgi:acyl-coenzyme A thioesterase PaaI-like protein
MVTPEEINTFLEQEFGGMNNRCVEVDDTWAIARHDAGSSMLRPGRIISGPTLFGLCDGVLWYALFREVGIAPMALTSELSIRFYGRQREMLC